jgi:hypothetical protein
MATQNYNAGFDITKVREFADLAAAIVGLLGLDAGQQTGLIGATAELHEAIDDPAADKGRMRRAVDAVMGYVKLGGDTALREAAITAGNLAGNELDIAIRHMHLEPTSRHYPPRRGRCQARQPPRRLRSQAKRTDSKAADAKTPEPARVGGLCMSRGCNDVENLRRILERHGQQMGAVQVG